MRPLAHAVVVAVAILLGSTRSSSAQANAARGVTVEWDAYGHDGGGTKHSPAAQITRGNVKNLVPVWTYRTGDFALGEGMARDETTPLFVDNTLYASTPFGGVRAIDGNTGSELWSFD